MTRRFLRWMRGFFLPPAEARLRVKLLPYLVLGFLTLFVLVSGVYAWDYTNSPEFCGTACHTMPPEFTAYLTSPHARIDCVECHIGRGFVATQITRKAGDISHIISLAFRDYEFPIRVKTLRPARDTCERCHFPEKFSDDSLREVKRFTPDVTNTPISIYLTMKTGGGSKRAGLGRGIHWHIENEIFYLAQDPAEQNIPYVRSVSDDGTISEYVDVESGFNPDSVDPEDLERMDCITCHNRITHLISQPIDTVDQLLARNAISISIPEIRLKAVEVFGAEYESKEHALNGIAGLEGYYRVVYPEFYAESRELIVEAIAALQSAYDNSVFPEQKASWNTHPDNVGHQESPGCFRCHDGKHLNEQEEAIRLECNLCHSVPVVAGPNDIVAEIEISRGIEPQSHLNANWIALHHEVLDTSCENCHTIEDPGGTSNTSFCSNSACHGSVFTFAGFDAPTLRQILLKQLPEVQVPVEPVPEEGPLTFEATVGPLLQARCGSCHGEGGIQGLDVTGYDSTVAGGDSGPAVVPGDAKASLLVQRQSGQQPHFGQFSPEELAQVVEWIEAGAPDS